MDPAEVYVEYFDCTLHETPPGCLHRAEGEGDICARAAKKWSSPFAPHRRRPDVNNLPSMDNSI